MLKDKLDELKEFLEDENTKDAFVKSLNDSIDLPFFNEKSEAKIFNAAYSAFAGTLIKLIGD